MNALTAYGRPAPLAVFFLGISSGFPLALVLATLTYWLSKLGIQKSTVGLFALATVPYAIKFLWSPFLDQIRLPLSRQLGHRRLWLWLIHSLLVGALICLGFSDPAQNIFSTALWVLVVAFLSASQDIVIDAYRIEILSDEELAYGSATINFGYRLGLLASGAGTILLSTHVGWPLAYALTGLLVLPGALAALFYGESRKDFADAAPTDESYFERTIAAPFKAFLAIDGALLILAFIVLYKVGDALANTMISPLMVELGFSDDDVVFANKLVGFWALIAGTALGPPLLNKLGMAKALLATGIFMMLTNVLFALLATQGNDIRFLALAIGLENFSSGVGLAVFTTYISGLCNIAFTGTHYALLSSVAVIGRTFVASTGGFLAESLGWVLFFLATTVAALPGLLLLRVLWRRGYTGEAVRSQKQGEASLSRGAVAAFAVGLLALLLVGSLWRYLA